MFRDPNTWNNQESVPEGSSDADDSLLFLQKHYEPIENKDDGFESYSIKARKFKEIQYLRQLNAQSNNPNEEKAPQNIFQRQTFYNDLAIGDDEPVKPGNIDYTDDFRNNNNTVTSAMSAMSDRRDFSNQGPQSSSWRIVSGSKQNLDSTPSQSFRIKRDTCITQDFSEATPTANDGYSTGKSKAGSQYGYYAGLNAVETNKAGSLRDINQKFRGTARSIILVEDEEKEIQNKRKMLLPKPPVADVKKRPQSKDANRLLYSQNAGDLRPNTTNPKNNKRLVIKARNSQILNMESGYTSPDKTKESSDQNVSEGFELSLVNSPFNQQLNKTNLSPIRSESVRSSFTYMESKANIANNAQNVGNQNMGTKVLTRVIQPFNKNFDDSPMAPGLSLEKNKGMSSSDKPAGSTMTNSMKKGRNENINSIADSKDPLAKQRNMRGVPEEIVRNNDPLKQHLKPQSQKKPENKPQPKTPPKVALMKVNNNMKVEQLIKGKKTYNHKTNMTEYLKRRGLKENTKIFCFNSRDEYIRRALKKFGWVENPHLNSFLFDFKWTYTDTEVDYANLMDGQFFNHFQNNKEITTKSGLIENVRSCADHGTGFWSFFPRAYDLGHINQMKEFQEDFERTALMNLLKKHWEYIKSKADPCVIRKIKEKFRTKQEKLAREGIIDIFKKKKLIKNVVYAEEVTRKDFIMYLSLLETALNCARTLVHQHKNVAEADNYFALSTLNERARSALLTYSKYNPPYDTIPLATRKSLGGGEEQWETPNELMIYKVYKFKELIKKFSPQYKIDGIQNTWIIKASGNARGSGIFLTDKLEEALDSGMKNQARIIQKYIENPLVIKDFPFKPMNNKKFDIRQWVLVSSMNPLVIYMFSSCYLRICSQDFDLKDIKNQYSHLTNFSLNKGNFQGGVEESICHVDVLKDYLKYTKNIDWDSRIKPKIVDIIIKTISSASDSIEHRPGCFDVYGFDLLLDDKCQPWLLEVNLSPACSERAPWLIEMLDEMGEHLLKCILPADYLQVPENNNNEENKTPEPTKTDEQPPKEIQEKKSPKYSWDLIYKAEAPRDFANTNIMLEIAGVKANIRKEQEIDKKYYSHMAAIRIQKTYKMYRAKKLKLFLKQSKVIVVIQKYVRRFLAKALLKKLRETRARNIIKNLLEIQRINKRIIDFRRERAAIRIQKHGRGYLARKLFKHMNYVKDIIKIQSNWRRAIAVRKKLALRKELVMTIRIQRFWRKRFKMLKNKATKIRAYWKMWKARKAFMLFMKKKRSAIKMQCAVRMFLAKLCKQRLLIERAELKLKHLRILKYGKKMFDGLQLSKKYTKFFQILNGIILKVSLKAIASRAEIRNHNACIIQGLVKIRKAKIRLRRLRRRKMIVRIQAFWRMYSKKKRYLMHKQIVRAVVFLQKNIRMFLAVCKLRDLQHERELKEYALALQIQREEERMIEEQKEMERRKQDMIKKRQNYFKQKDHITFLHQSVPKSKQMAATKMNKTNTEAFNIEKKKQEILKNTEHMLKSIYKEMPLKPGTAMGKKPPTRGGMGGMNMMMPKKTEENSYQFSGPDENRNFDTLYKLFSKNTGFH